MTIDHIGAYIYPEQLWLRVIGRAAAPIFLFLTGYSGATRISLNLVGSAFLLSLLSCIIYDPLLPLNILWTIVICRAFNTFMERKGTLFLEKNLWSILLSYFVWHIALVFIFDYGALAILVSVSGYLCRKYHNGELNNPRQIRIFHFIILLLYASSEAFLGLEFSKIQMVVIYALLLVVFWGLMQFRNYTPDATGRLDILVKTISRYSLVYYVTHKLILVGVAAFMHPELSNAMSLFDRKLFELRTNY